MSELIWLFLNLWFVMKINFWRMSQLIWLFLNQWFVMKISFWGMSQLIWVFWKEIFLDKKKDLIASRISPGLGSKIVKFQCWQRILLITRNRWSTEVAYVVNGNCLRIHLGTLQCLVETSGIVEDSDYKSQGSQEENYFFTSVLFECCFL